MANAADVAQLHGQREAPAAAGPPAGQPLGQRAASQELRAKAGAGEPSAYLCQGPWEPRRPQHQQRQQQ